MTPQHIANYFIGRSLESSIDMSPHTLQRLVYLAYGWYSAVMPRGRDRLFREPIQVYRYGPIIATLYHNVKHTKTVLKKCTLPSNEDIDISSGELPMYCPEVEHASPVGIVLDKVWQAYANNSKLDKSDLLYIETYKKGMPVIRHTDIRRHFVSLRKEIVNQSEQD